MAIPIIPIVHVFGFFNTVIGARWALVCLFGIVLFGTYRYQQHLKITQASRDLTYALSKLNYAVERTGIIVNDKLPNVQINRDSNRPFAHIEQASRRA